MTPEQQNIAIAEACGFTRDSHDARLFTKDGKTFYSETPGRWLGTSYRPLPNYVGDLNAMAEARKVLFNDQYGKYVTVLERLTGADKDIEWDIIKFKLANATADQHAEAFLRAIGKRKDGGAP